MIVTNMEAVSNLSSLLYGFSLYLICDNVSELTAPFRLANAFIFTFSAILVAVYGFKTNRRFTKSEVRWSISPRASFGPALIHTTRTSA